jgi:hypothetical protein
MLKHLFFSPDETPGTASAPVLAPAPVAPVVAPVAPAPVPAPSDPLSALTARLDAAEKAAAESATKLAKLHELRTGDAVRTALADIKWPELLETSAFAGVREVDDTGSLTPAAQAKIAEIRKMHPEWFGSTGYNPGAIPSSVNPSGAPQVLAPSEWFKLYDDPATRAKALSPEYQAAVSRGRLQALK